MVSSGAGSLADMGAGTPAYSVSKAALNAMTRILAAELSEDGVLVNSVCPGWVATDMGGSGGRPVEDGAGSVMWAVLLGDDGPTGGFFRDGKPVERNVPNQLAPALCRQVVHKFRVDATFAERLHDTARSR